MPRINKHLYTAQPKKNTKDYSMRGFAAVVKNKSVASVLVKAVFV